MRPRPVTPAVIVRRALWEVLHRMPSRSLTVRTRHGVLSVGNKDRTIGRLLFTWREFELDNREDERALIQVQGHEAQVLEGAPRLLAAGLPVVTEFWPYGLQRSGASGRNFAALLRASFTTFYDLADETPAPRPIADVPSLFRRSTGTSFTDLLLLH